MNYPAPFVGSVHYNSSRLQLQEANLSSTAEYHCFIVNDKITEALERHGLLVDNQNTVNWYLLNSIVARLPLHDNQQFCKSSGIFDYTAIGVVHQP